jgi:RNA polymerase sigma factor (sigma-70 family)
MPTDSQLLRIFITRQDGSSFAELVRRHAGLVYGTALRKLAGNRHLAEEVAQKVFADFARKGPSLLAHPSLAGWLHRSTCFASATALRAELRQEKIARAFAMTSEPSKSSFSADWDGLRPVLDQAIDQLNQRDRQVVLLRHFEELSYTEIGARLGLAENTARMRADRALGRLKDRLCRLGVTSTAAALELLLANAAVAAPPGLMAAAASAALATPPSGLFSLLLMSKITMPAVCAILAASATLTAGLYFVPGVSGDELAGLRQRHTLLLAAANPQASPQAVAAVAADIQAAVASTAAATKSLDTRLAQHQAAVRVRSEAGATGGPAPAPPRDHATSRAAMSSFAAAANDGDVDALAKLIWFDPPVRERALAILGTMPQAVQAEYNTPEKFYALLLAADALIAPAPPPEIVAQIQTTDISPGRAAQISESGTPDLKRQYQQTPDGWKYVMALPLVEAMPNLLNNPELLQTGEK